MELTTKKDMVVDDSITLSDISAIEKKVTYDNMLSLLNMIPMPHRHHIVNKMAKINELVPTLDVTDEILYVVAIEDNVVNIRATTEMTSRMGLDDSDVEWMLRYEVKV